MLPSSSVPSSILRVLNGRGQGGDSRDAVLTQMGLVWTGFFASPQLVGKGGAWYRVLLIACRFDYFVGVGAAGLA